jgi:hypothetical protein
LEFEVTAAGARAGLQPVPLQDAQFVQQDGVEDGKNGAQLDMGSQFFVQLTSQGCIAISPSVGRASGTCLVCQNGLKWPELASGFAGEHGALPQC